MFGPGYVLSWDMVRWLGASREDLQPFMGLPEDKSISEMIKFGGKAEECWISVDREYMFHFASWENAGAELHSWVRPLGPDVILVHGLKRDLLLGEVIDYYLGNHSTVVEGFSG
jgi:hypothetical protein